MSDVVRGLVVFCEGPHDIAFVSKALKYCLGFKRNQELTLNEFTCVIGKGIMALLAAESKAPNDDARQPAVKSQAELDLPIHDNSRRR